MREVCNERIIGENGTFTTNDIHFASGSDKIEPNSANVLNEIGEAMKSASGTIFVIIGHTDSDGEEADNQILSDKRGFGS
jgi:outer membrane protein OmpA-like peptidoglycan-associated protein